jgi:hypothetical protein
MSGFNRAFMSLLLLAWCAALGGLMYLVWYQDRIVDLSNRVFRLNFDVITNSRSDQILATIVLGALMLPALLLLLMELKPSRRRVDVRDREREVAHEREMPGEPVRDARYSELESRVETLQRRLDEEHRIQSRPETPVADVESREGQSPRHREQERRGWRFLPSRR